MLEEVDELWDEVKKKKANRTKAAIAEECSQIASMAFRIMVDCCGCGCELSEKCEICHPDILKYTIPSREAACKHPRKSLKQDPEHGAWHCGICYKYIPLEELKEINNR